MPIANWIRRFLTLPKFWIFELTRVLFGTTSSSPWTLVMRVVLMPTDLTRPSLSSSLM